MSQLNSLLESAGQGWKNMQSDAARLASKWDKTGLLEGLGNETHKNNMSLILENQAKQLVVESSQTGGGTNSVGTFTAGVGEQWAGIALPLVRKVFGQIAAKEFVSVQPMNLPSGLVFYLDFQYGTDKNPFSAEGSMFGDKNANYPFATANTATGGLYGAGRFSYSINLTSSTSANLASGSAVTEATWADLNFDSDYSASAVAGNITKFAVPVAQLPLYDDEAVRSFVVSSGSYTSALLLPAFTSTDGSTVDFYFNAAPSALGTNSQLAMSWSLQPTDKNRGDFEDGNTALNANNNPIAIPEINIQMVSEAIVAKTRKLKAVWTPEFAQDLNAYQSLDAEAELTNIMSEYISLEIDLEILDMLIQDAAAGTEYWSVKNNQVINAGTTAFEDATSGFYNTQGQWFQTLGTKLQKLSNKIHQLTLRGGANFMVVSPTVATIIESIPGFASNSDGDVSKASYAFGVQKAGQLNSRYTVYKNPYMTENTILMGFRGSQFLEAGAVFAPYIPLIMTPLLYDPDTFTPRKGLLTRYAKKMLRPEFYGKVYVEGLNTL
jgi:hypothetical protein